MARLELAASCSQSRRATNCATPGYFVVLSGWAYSPKAGAIPVAVPCKSGVRQSGLAFCRPRPRARLPQSATGGGRLASQLGYTRVCRTYRQGILYMKPRKNATPKCGNPAASRNAEIRRRSCGGGRGNGKTSVCSGHTEVFAFRITVKQKGLLEHFYHICFNLVQAGGIFGPRISVLKKANA